MCQRDSENFIKALENGDRELMKLVPKADVHNHTALGGDFNIWVKSENLDFAEGAHHFPDFTDFQNLVDTIFTYPHKNATNQQRIDRFLSLFAATYKTAINNGVSYIEPGYDSVLLDYYDMNITTMIGQLEEQVKMFGSYLKIAPDIGIIRAFDKAFIERCDEVFVRAGNTPQCMSFK